jgi:uncharacterized protein YuzE
MRLKYYKDTDSLYIDLTERHSIESLEIAPGVVVDFDQNHEITGIDIDHASKILNFGKFEVSNIPSKKVIFSPVQV